MTMHVNLSPEMEGFIRTKVASGVALVLPLFRGRLTA